MIFSLVFGAKGTTMASHTLAEVYQGTVVVAVWYLWQLYHGPVQFCLAVSQLTPPTQNFGLLVVPKQWGGGVCCPPMCLTM